MGLVVIVHAMMHIVVVAAELQALHKREGVTEGIGYGAEIGIVFFHVQRQRGEPGIPVGFPAYGQEKTMIGVWLPQESAGNRLALKPGLYTFAVTRVIVLIIAVAAGQTKRQGGSTGTDRCFGSKTVVIAGIGRPNRTMRIPVG